jgi:hypothetical protein
MDGFLYQRDEKIIASAGPDLAMSGMVLPFVACMVDIHEYGLIV